MEGNRRLLDELVERFRFWLHIEDPYVIYTIAAVKASNKMSGDPVWLMLIGPSSDGKSEILRAFTQPEDFSVDDITPKTFVSGFIQPKEDKNGNPIEPKPHFAEKIAGNILFVYDLSILMSKHYEDRSTILSDMRMIYDGCLKKEYGNRVEVEVNTEGTTLICGSTPLIDKTILEDQLMGTRFITYRTHTEDRDAVMKKIMENIPNMAALRSSLKVGVQMFENNIKLEEITVERPTQEKLMSLGNQTALLRTSASLDRNREPDNIIYPEGPGRILKQLINLYRGYRVIGLSDEEAVEGIRRLCRYNVIPVRVKLLKYLKTKTDEWVTTSNVAVHTKLGKGTSKGQLYTLTQLGLVDYKVMEVFHREVDQWKLLDCDLDFFLGVDDKQKVLEVDEDKPPVFEKLPDQVEGVCGYCGFKMVLLFRDDKGHLVCERCQAESNQS